MNSQKTSEELIKEYLENGGKITKCKNFYPPNTNREIKVRPSFNLKDKEYRNQQADRFNTKSNIIKSTKIETETIFGVDIQFEK